MNRFTNYLAAATAIGGMSAPLAAQNPYPYGYQQPVPQPYPGQPGYGYQQGYPGQPGYNQGYTGNPVTDVIDQLLGNRYNVTDRQAVRQCANAARTQAMQQYGGYNNGYGNQYGNQYGNPRILAPQLRVTAITDVQRRSDGLRVSGMMGTGYAGNQYGYQNRGYPQQGYAPGDVSFRCNVDYRGAVTDIRIGNRNNGYRRY